MKGKQDKQKLYHDKETVQLRTFKIDDCVRVKNHQHQKIKWLPGKVVQVSGSHTYLVQMQGSGKMRYTHVDQMLPLDESVFQSPIVGITVPVPSFEPSVITTPSQIVASDITVTNSQSRDIPPHNNTSTPELHNDARQNIPQTPVTPPIILRRSVREIKPRQILDL